MTSVFLEDRHAVGTRSDGPGVERKIVAREPLLRVKAVRFGRHGREKGHREPVRKLRVLSVHANFERVRVDRAHAPNFVRRQVKVARRRRFAPFPTGFLFVGKLCGELVEPHDVVRERTENGTHDPGAREALDAPDVVVGRKFAGRRVLEVGGRALLRRHLERKIVIEKPPVGVFGERGMRCVENPFANRNRVDRLGDRCGIGIVGQRPPRCVYVGRVHDALGRATDKFVGALQVVVLIKRLIDVVRIDRLIRRVGALRVERSRASPAEGRKERVRSVFGRGARRVEEKRLLGRVRRPGRCERNHEPRRACDPCRATPGGAAWKACATLRKRQKLA